MIKYNIRITADAHRDLNKIIDYISLDLFSPEIANKLFNKITYSISTLEYFPKRYHVLEETNQKSINLRMMLVDNFSIIYVVDTYEVVITNILNSSSNIKEKI